MELDQYIETNSQTKSLIGSSPGGKENTQLNYLS